MPDWLPSPKSLIKLTIGLIVVFGITDLIGFKNVILSPISSWKNRNAA